MKISHQVLNAWGVNPITIKVFSIYIIFALATSALVYLTIDLSGFRKELLDLWYEIYRPLWLVFPVSIAQEIFFRGWLMQILRRKFPGSVKAIILNAVIFALIHLIFPYREFLVPGAFLLGLSYAAIYYFYPNLILISLTHVLLNLLVIPYCYFGCWN